jgi:hypothetical protein
MEFYRRRNANTPKKKGNRKEVLLYTKTGKGAYPITTTPMPIFLAPFSLVSSGNKLFFLRG